MELTQIGKYQVIAKIGQGAMGEVYKARDPVLGRFVAVKTIAERSDSNDVMRQKFHREARAAAQLNHPNIITVYEFGEEEGMAYIVMELLEGTDLKEIIEEGTLEGLDNKLSVLEQICDGLAFAHAKGVVHRDLKPGNIHILPSGQVKIMDFGLARRAEDAARTSAVMGTPYYMAPEQAQGGRPSARSDIFSLGAVFYEVLAGRRPFVGDSVPAVLYRVVHAEPEPLGKWIPEIPALVRVVEKALAKDPDKRYENAGAMREALSAVRQAFGTGPGYDSEAPTVAGIGPPDLPAARTLTQTLSEAEDTAQPIKDAIHEVQLYLADRVPPLMVEDSVRLLLDCAPDGVASDIYAWAAEQSRRQSLVPLADFLFYSFRKLHLMGEFKLVEKERLRDFLHEMGESILLYCPPEDREALRRNLANLDQETATSLESFGSPIAPSNTVFERRFSHLLGLLNRYGIASGKGKRDDSAWSQLISQVLTTAVTNAKSQQELDQHLARLNQFGVVPGVEQIFRSLGEGVSGFLPPPGAAATPERTGEVAMRRVISLAEEPMEVARRFRGMVYAAIEQFNEGNLGRAVKMFDVAEKLIEEKQIEGGLAESIRRKGHESLRPERLRKFAESPEKRGRLRTVLNFFHYGLGPRVLLDELRAEPRRDRRRLLLDLLEAHGLPARTEVVKMLDAYRAGEDDPGPYMLRNLIYLLRQIPRSGEEGVEAEIDGVARLGEPGLPPFLVREAIATLAAMKQNRAKQALVNLLHVYETSLVKDMVSDRAESLALVDRICSALIRSGHPAAWLAVLEHALGQGPEMGSALNRLVEFSSQDLSSNPPVVARLLGELKARLPRGVMKFLVAKNDQELTCLLEALSGTPMAEVQEAMSDVARRFSGHVFARTAIQALEGFAARARAPLAPPPTKNESGELETFGLPNLLEKLGDQRATGLLSLLDAQGTPLAALTLEGGGVRTCQAGRLQGEEAFLQLLERPFPCSFSLIGRPGPAGPPAARDFLDVPRLVEEGMRRYDAFQKARALVPDEFPLEATGANPSTVPGEADYSLVVSLWEKACAGVTPSECEAEIPVDSFRIRNALAHWVEEGSLRPREAQ